MAQKLWEKNVQVNAEIDRFTVGRDREMDMYLAKYDVLGSMAHITMLESIGLLTSDELKILLEELKNIYASVERGEFVIEDGIEDVHSQVQPQECAGAFELRPAERLLAHDHRLSGAHRRRPARHR